MELIFRKKEIKLSNFSKGYLAFVERSLSLEVVRENISVKDT
jgi:hypothetical protein